MAWTHPLPSLWEANQDPVVSRILPDTARCPWYGERPGWACAPDGLPWERNIHDIADLEGFLAGFAAEGLDLSHRDRRHPVIFLFSGYHWLNDFHAFPDLGIGFCNLWAWRMEEGTPVAHDQVGPGYLMRLLLEMSAGLLDTGVDPSVEGSVGNGSWDLMSMGYAGFSSRGYELEEGQQVHWPALLNPIDRYRLGWIGNAHMQEYPGRLLVEPGETILRRNLSDPAEITAIQNFPNSEEHPMRYHIGADPTGQQLVFCSHRAQVAAGNTLYYRPGLMRPDTVLTNDGELPALDDHYASWPLWEQSLTPRMSWNTYSVNDSLWRHHLTDGSA